MHDIIAHMIRTENFCLSFSVVPFFFLFLKSMIHCTYLG